MPIRTGAQFLQALKDGRRVWLRGEKVEDVTTHPALAGCAQALAEVYDLQHDPAYRDLLTMESPTTGQVVSAGFRLPHSPADLQRRRQMIEFLARRTGGVAGRIPEYVDLFLVGLYDVRELLAEEDPAFAEHAVAYFEYCRENDLHVTHAFADPSRDQSRPPADFEFLRVVEERPDGVVIRGAKAVATSAPFADEFLGMALPRLGLTAEQAIWFAVPLNAKGIQMICREPLVPRYPEDHPLSPHWDEMDAFVVFDDVFVPKERVFYRRRRPPEEPPPYQRVFAPVTMLAGWHILIRMAVKAEVLAGICIGLTEYFGTAKQPHIQLALCDALVYVETLKALLQAAEANPIPSPSGLLIPNPTQTTVARIYGIEQHPNILQLIRELSGSSILMAPGQAELNHPELREPIYRYFVGKDERAPERFRLVKLAWEYACDSFGSRQLLFEMYNAGGSVTLTKTGLVSRYDTAPLVNLAKDLAGIHRDRTELSAFSHQHSGPPL